jgi:phospholipid/cholesterol/gamma-HCH transport system ATP-binding protein
MSDSTSLPAIEFRGVSFSFDEQRVLDNVSFKLDRGEMIFLTGGSGSGKSVLLHLAIGLLKPDEGQIFVEGREIGRLDEAELLALRGGRMGIVFQSESLFSGLDGYDNAAYRLVERGTPADKVETAVDDALRFVGLERDADKFPAELSGGMRRRLEIARGMIGWPSIMFFDEPTLSLDPITATQIMDLVIRARDVYGMSSIYVTKRLDEFPYLATHTARVQENGSVTITEVDAETAPPRTRILVLEKGRIIFEGLTHAENGTVFSGYEPADPWDKKRRPREAIL